MKQPTPEKVIENIDKRMNILNKRFYRYTEKINKELEALSSQRFKQSMRISKKEALFRKRCKHKIEYGRKKWANSRDDASFGTYVACARCEETLWDECYGEGGYY